MTAATDRSTLLIWDCDKEPPPGDWLTALWQSYDTGKRADVISIPQLVEDNSESLRAKYLAWIYDLGESKVNGKRIVDHLEIRPGLSYWWMTLLAQKCTYAASPNIYHAVRLLACEHLCRSPAIRRIKVVTSSPMLAAEFRDWCTDHARAFEATLLKSNSPAPPVWRAMLHRLPTPILGLISMCRYGFRRFSLRRPVTPARSAARGAVMFFDILTHFNKSSAESGVFESGYWTTLPALIRKSGWSVSWSHLFYGHRATPRVADARTVVDQLNQVTATTGRHFLVDAQFGLACFAKSLLDFCRLIRRFIRIRRFPTCRPQESGFSFRNLFQHEWKESFLGHSAATTICQLNALESFVRSVPRQRLGVYIQEYQPWELALLHTWRAAGHGPIVGTPHTTIRFWDLRYFYDPRTFLDSGKNTLPLPDKVALNGPVAFAAYATGLGPLDRLVEVEALRFTSVGDSITTSDHGATAKSLQDKPPVLLVATDLLDENTRTQLDWLASASAILRDRFEIVVRPHPASDLEPAKYPGLQSCIDRSDLACLLKRVDAMYASNASSIALNGYLEGKHIVTHRDGTRFDFSPLRGLPNTTFVASAMDLGELLGRWNHHRNTQPVDYFYLDVHLPRWRKLLSE